MTPAPQEAEVRAHLSPHIWNQPGQPNESLSQRRWSILGAQEFYSLLEACKTKQNKSFPRLHSQRVWLRRPRMGWVSPFLRLPLCMEHTVTLLNPYGGFCQILSWDLSCQRPPLWNREVKMVEWYYYLVMLTHVSEPLKRIAEAVSGLQRSRPPRAIEVTQQMTVFSTKPEGLRSTPIRDPHSRRRKPTPLTCTHV